MSAEVEPVKAVLFTGRGQVEIVEKPKPAAKDDIVVVRVTASGICGTDLELLLPAENPLSTIPGHEVVGIVEEVDKAEKFKVGDRVIVNCHVTCGECEHCKNGDLIFCWDLRVIGFELDGGNAEYVAVPEASLRHLPDDISDEVGVLIGDALGTPYHAVKKAGIVPGDIVGIFGVGPLGIMAVLTAKSFGATVIAVDVSDKRLDTAREFGADYVVNSRAFGPHEEILRITKGIGLDIAIDCSGNASAIVAALETLKLRGKLIQVGVCERLCINTQEHIVNKEIQIIGSRNFNDNELNEIIQFARNNPKIKNLISHTFTLDEAKKAFEMAMRREGLKMVIKP
jgi:2-desacetyl-2-hydroxyethyl bacteriochlorophyllide A dehydrogenase